MKVRLLILLFGFSLIGHSFGQDLIKETSQTPQEIYDFHMKKSKALATAGAITLVAGPAMMVGGFFISFDFM